MMKRILAVFFAVCCIFTAACGSGKNADEPEKEAVSAMDDTADITTDVAVDEASEGSGEAVAFAPVRYTEEEKLERMKALRLSVTEASYYHSTSKDATSSRLDDYFDIGITAIRINPVFDRPSEGVWRMTDEMKHILEAAAERGLLVKLIPQTIKDPPDWLLSNENARFKDSNGRLAHSAVSYWYDGLKDYCETALRAQLDELKKHELLEVIGSIAVDLGAWGEPNYPHAASEHHMGADAAWYTDASLSIYTEDAVFWCYGDNAITDFQAKMREKYGTIAEANRAWGTSYAGFSNVAVPKEGEVKGQLWEDMLTWYLQVKRDFCEWQVGMYAQVVSEYFEDIPLVLVPAGAGSYTKREWNESVMNGTATDSMKIGGINSHVVDLAYKHDCILQYGGLENLEDGELQRMLKYMHDTGKTGITFFGENPASIHNDNDPASKVDLIRHFGLDGFDYMYALYLYEDDGVTKTEFYYKLKDSIKLIEQIINDSVPWMPGNSAEPRGDTLRYDAAFETVQDGDYAYTFTKIATLDYIVAEGDTLEYDVRISEPIMGLGALDGMIDGETIRDNIAIIDQNWRQAHPGNDLSDLAYGEWYARELDISNKDTVGKELTEIQLATHPGNAFEFSGVTATIWYDNIRITNNGEVKQVIFESASDIDISKSELIGHRLATAKVSVVNAIDAGVQLIRRERKFTPITAKEIVKLMGVGCVIEDFIGNIKDTETYHLAWNAPTGPTSSVEVSWAGILCDKWHIESVAQRGFDTFLYRVHWAGHTDENLRVSEDWLDRLEQIVGWALDAGLYIIIEGADDVLISDYLYNGRYDLARNFLTAVWTQVATRFKDYPQQLIFQVMHEPSIMPEGVPFDPSGWATDNDGNLLGELIDSVNRLNDDALKAIRKTGGNNGQRNVILATPAARAFSAELMKPPQDDYIMYSGFVIPWAVSGWNEFNKMKDFINSTGIPIFDQESLLNDFSMDYYLNGVRGGWSTFDLRDDFDRDSFLAASHEKQRDMIIFEMAARCAELNIPIMFNLNNYFSDYYSLFDPITGQWVNDSMAQALFKGYGKAIGTKAKTYSAQSYFPIELTGPFIHGDGNYFSVTPPAVRKLVRRIVVEYEGKITEECAFAVFGRDIEWKDFYDWNNAEHKRISYNEGKIIFDLSGLEGESFSFRYGWIPPEERDPNKRFEPFSSFVIKRIVIES